MHTKPRISEQLRKYELSNLAEAFTILDTILDAKSNLGLTQLCIRTNFPKNKTFRLLATLEQFGFVEKDSYSNYCVGSNALATAQKIITKAALLDKVRPYMRELTEIVNESVYFARQAQDEVVLVDYADCSQAIKASSFVGRRYRLSEVSSANTIISSAGCVGEIAVDVGGIDPDVTAVSARFNDMHGVCVGALIVIGPSFRMNLECITLKIVPALRSVLQKHSLMPQNLKRIPPSSYDCSDYGSKVISKGCSVLRK